MPTLVFEQTPNGVIAVMGRVTPSDADWDAYLASISAAVALGATSRALVISDGGAPSPAQRARLDRATAPIAGRLKAAIVTGSTFVRGVLNAMALINGGYRAFAPDRLDDAFAYLDIRPTDAVQMRELVEALRKKLGS